MRFWDWIGEILLFRWLFGHHTEHDTVNEDRFSRFDFDEEQDDYDMMDDDF